VLRADAEIDRLRNLIFLRHIENPENVQRHASLQVIFMTQSSNAPAIMQEPRRGSVPFRQRPHCPPCPDDLRQPIEQMFLDWLRAREDH